MAMQLYASATSPYARKVRIALIELGFSDRVQIVPTVAREDPGYRAVNPLGKIPALRIDDGSVLYDSFVIVDWLDQAAGGGRLIPLDAAARNAELRRHALANGIIDAAYNLVMELGRKEDERSAFWIARWSDTIQAADDVLADELPNDITLASITAATAVDYVAFRLSALDLQTPRLSNWRATLGARPSLDTTFPHLELR